MVSCFVRDMLHVHGDLLHAIARCGGKPVTKLPVFPDLDIPDFSLSNCQHLDLEHLSFLFPVLSNFFQSANRLSFNSLWRQGGIWVQISLPGHNKGERTATACYWHLFFSLETNQYGASNIHSL